LYSLISVFGPRALTKLQEEAVPESLKNILLVMANGGFFENAGGDREVNKKNQELWDRTWQRLERFLPDLKGELFPPEPEVPPAAAEEPKVKDVEVLPAGAAEKEKVESAVTIAAGGGNLADID
jgi:golgi-specific brefeldin A-resistance guanine nucleotide exchange factor 1